MYVYRCVCICVYVRVCLCMSVLVYAYAYACTNVRIPCTFATTKINMCVLLFSNEKMLTKTQNPITPTTHHPHHYRHLY